MDQTDPCRRRTAAFSTRPLLGGGLVGCLALLDQRADPIGLFAGRMWRPSASTTSTSRSQLITRVSTGWSAQAAFRRSG
jgi:hypothetical protein